MALITWDGSYSVNIADIDRQHQKLMEMINDLDAAMRSGKGKEVLANIIHGLVTYTRTHFTTEESYFDKFGYADASSHKLEHSNFVRKVSQFKDDFEKGRIGLSIEVMNFLSDWLKNHIKGTDKKYDPFLNELKFCGFPYISTLASTDVRPY